MLMHWRRPGQAKWVPLLDTTMLNVGKDTRQTYWPISIVGDKFQCIILKVYGLESILIAGRGERSILPKTIVQ